MMVRAALLVAFLPLAGVLAADEVVVNKAKDIRILTDRKESVPEFFQRNRILTGGLSGEELARVIEAKKPLDKLFVNYASYNDDPEKGALFGAVIKLAPPSEAARKLLTAHKPDGMKVLNLTLILRRDDKEPELFTVVGCTDRTPVGFFTVDKKNDADGFSQTDLRFKK
jgi:hypothetical protein